MKKRIKTDDLLGRYYKIKTVDDYEILFRTNRIVNGRYLHGWNEEMEARSIRIEDISDIERQGIQYELQHQTNQKEAGKTK